MGEERGGVGPTMNERSAGDVAEKSEKRKVSKRKTTKRKGKRSKKK